MVSKVAPSGNSFKNLLNYLYEGRMEGRRATEKNAIYISSSNDLFIPLSFEDKIFRELLKKQFIEQSQTYSNYKIDGNYVGHHILSFSNSESKKLDKLAMKDIVEDYLAYMKLDKTQYIALSHSDTDNKHIHLVFNRIQNNSKLYNSHNEARKSATVVTALLIDRKLKLEKGQKPLAYSKQGIEFRVQSKYLPELDQNKLLLKARNIKHLEKLAEKLDIKVERNLSKDSYGGYSIGNEYFHVHDLNAFFNRNRSEAQEKTLEISNNRNESAQVEIQKAYFPKEFEILNKTIDLPETYIPIQMDDFKPYTKRKRVNGLKIKLEKLKINRKSLKINL